jgi:hypothetical protein
MNLFNKTEPQVVTVKGHELRCPICNNAYFWKRKVHKNTAFGTFFKLDWTDPDSTCFICSDCTHISWFAGDNKP